MNFASAIILPYLFLTNKTWQLMLRYPMTLSFLSNTRTLSRSPRVGGCYHNNLLPLFPALYHNHTVRVHRVHQQSLVTCKTSRYQPIMVRPGCLCLAYRASNVRNAKNIFLTKVSEGKDAIFDASETLVRLLTG
jgi:hypothetical protein